MKPAWDKLMLEYSDSTSVMIADVDCTTEGKPLCDSNGVKGFPSIKSGDPASLEDYSGGRDYDALAAFAKTLKPLCSPLNMDLCDDEGRAAIEKVQALSEEEIATFITENEKKSEEAEETFKSEVEKLQNKYQELTKEKDDLIESIKKSGLGLYKSVQATNKAASKAAPKEDL